MILKIYDFMRAHKGWCALSFVAVTSILAALMLRLNFKEDISAFLPLEGRNRQSMTVYQEVSGSNRILAIIEHSDTADTDPDALSQGIEALAQNISDALAAELSDKSMIYQVDLEQAVELTDFVYAHIPYFLLEEDYAGMDSLLGSSDYLSRRLDEDKRMLMFPTSGLLSANLSKDPLNLFSATVSKLNTGIDMGMEIYDGYIFTSDMKRAVMMLESPYGNSESQRNAKLMAELDAAAEKTEAEHPEIKVHFIGGPPIAVANSSQIKKDSFLSIAISAVLILALLVAVFRRFRNILLIAISVGWGWLFALAVLSLVHDSVSLIVVGISSIILGLAVNYPLHLIAHAGHAQSMRQTLREIIAPLIIGNITTVGAFIALVPLKAAALRDLGFFSALILVGTILFTIVYLPHCVGVKGKGGTERRLKLLDALANFRPEKKKWLIWTVFALTLVFAYFSFHTSFDSDMSHINYLTAQQKEDLDYLHRMNDGIGRGQTCIYVVSEGKTLDQAMEASISMHASLKELALEIDSANFVSASRFMPSKAEQGRRIGRWNEFVSAHKELLTDSFTQAAVAAGFSDGAFQPFEEILEREYSPMDAGEFEALAAINSKFKVDAPDFKAVVGMLYVPTCRTEEAKKKIDAMQGQHFCFDVRSMNSAIASGLSDNFNYIGWACGLIVFFFLWFSFGSIELAMLSFLPMAVSWIWILGIMGLTGIQFNIVNIILATFIFGQGDDYTIFMTEGCCYEYGYRRKMLASYKSSIIISALIMFIGIGTLIVAKHPALKSLAEVTIVGMFSVVLMAFLLPPVVFNWMVKSRGEYRKRPLTISPLLRTWFCGAWWLAQLAVGYAYGCILFAFCGRNEKSESRLRKFVSRAHRLDLRIMPGVKFKIENPNGENFDRPCVIVCNHQSMLDPMLFMALSPKILIVANERSSLNPIVSRMFRWLRFYTIRRSNFTAWKDSTLERDMERFRGYIANGYSIAFFPEGLRNPDSSIVRYHKGPFYLAHELGVDLLPVLIHGVNHIMPINSFACYKGQVAMRIGKRISADSPQWRENYSEMTKTVRAEMMEGYARMRAELETPEYFKGLVLDRYRYKGADVMADVRRRLKTPALPAIPDSGKTTLVNVGYGETMLLAALVHPDVKIEVVEPNEDIRTLAKYAADGVAPNLAYIP